MRAVGLKICVFIVAALWALACQIVPADDTACEEKAVGKENATVGGFTPGGLASIEAFLETAIGEGRTKAAVAMIARDGEIVWLSAAGKMAPGVPMRDDAILPLASVGKMFTATAAMILYERGVISLSDPVSKYIPEFADIVVELKDENGDRSFVAPERPITIHHLLTHTGGLTVSGDEFWNAWNVQAGKTTTTHLARDLAKLPLYAQPGDRFRYGPTGASYEVLGAVIEIASRQTLEAFMTKNIFAPLNLNDSYFYLPTEKSNRMPAIYRKVDGVLKLDRAAGEDFPRSTFFHGGGGVRAAPQDVFRFSSLFLQRGSVDGVQLLKPETIAMMMADQLGDAAPRGWKSRGQSWGYGASIEYSDRDLGTPTKYGWVGGGFAKLWVDPKAKMVAYIGIPITPPGDNGLLREFERLVYAAMADTDAR